jgi:hypothetical protein
MVKIDFTKVEEKLSLGIQTMFMKKLIAGGATLSGNAVEFYRMNDGPRPKPKDTVIEGLEELKQEAKELEEQERLASLETLKEIPSQVGTAEVFQEPPKQEPEKKTEDKPIIGTPLITEKIPTTEEQEKVLPPIFLLKKHVDWFKKKRVKDFYKILGTTEEEVRDLRLKKVRTEQEEKRVEDILRRAKPLKTALLKKLGIAEDEALIDKERKKHLNKRINIRDTWLAL